jgi:hypothetical protein
MEHRSKLIFINTVLRHPMRHCWFMFTEGMLLFHHTFDIVLVLLKRHAHRPAGYFPHLKSSGAAFTRYPYRYLLFAGYKVLMPLFRGTLGFGNDFASANIKQQGLADLDDIVSSIDAARDANLIQKETKLGIFGGSYGG